jgi:hypothetical protein
LGGDGAFVVLTGPQDGTGDAAGHSNSNHGGDGNAALASGMSL